MTDFFETCTNKLYQSLLERKIFHNLKETQLFYLIIKLTKAFAVPKSCTRWNTKRRIGMIFFRADNDAVAKEILVNKCCTKASWLSETYSNHCQRITALLKWMIQKCFWCIVTQMQEDSSWKVLQVCLLLMDTSASMKIRHNISIIINMMIIHCILVSQTDKNSIFPLTRKAIFTWLQTHTIQQFEKICQFYLNI